MGTQLSLEVYIMHIQGSRGKGAPYGRTAWMKAWRWAKAPSLVTAGIHRAGEKISNICKQ